MIKKGILWFIIICLLFQVAGCSLSKNEVIEEKDVSELAVQLFGEEGNAFGNIMAPEGFDWRICEGITIDFIVENNINANILSKESEKFTAVTGINVRIRNMDFVTMKEKINIEFISQIGQYELIYVDPYQTLPLFKEGLEDLRKYEDDESLPHIVGGLESFSAKQVEVCSFYEEEDKLCAIPFDSTTMIFYYRKDIFEKYGEQMERDLGYMPLPGSAEFTWERYLEVSEWMGENIPKEEIRYPSVTMSADHNSIYTEFSNYLSAYGGDYFLEENINSIGLEVGKELHSDTPEFIKALEMYKKVNTSTELGKVGLTWDESANLFQNGEVAMMLNWDENAAKMENQKQSKVAGKTEYTVLPYGSERSANIYGGSGIGINKYVSEEKKLAAWLFIVWCTSPQIQIHTFLEEEGGNMPTQENLQHLISAYYMVKLPQAKAVINAQKPRYAYYRPKMKYGSEFELLMRKNLREYLQGDISAEEIGAKMKAEWAESINE